MTEPIINYDEHPIDRIYVEWANTLDSAGKDSGPARERVTDEVALSQLFANLENVIAVGQETDILKKYVFYGKESDEHLPSPLISHNARVNAGAALSDHNTMRILHAIMGHVSEAAEKAEMLAAHIFKGQLLDMENYIEESGDQLWYSALDAKACGFATLDEFMASNKAKLTARYGTEWSKDGAVNRNTEYEMNELDEALVGMQKVSDVVRDPASPEMFDLMDRIQEDKEKRIGPAGELDARTHAVKAAIEKFPTLSSIVSQLSVCGYQSRFSEDIEHNQAFLALRHYAYKEWLLTHPVTTPDSPQEILGDIKGDPPTPVG